MRDNLEMIAGILFIALFVVAIEVAPAIIVIVGLYKIVELIFG